MRSTTKRRQGFTLIELLVAIAIIAILAAFLFPVFASARERSHQSVCLSNERQIWTAMRLYVDDHDGNFPQMQWEAPCPDNRDSNCQTSWKEMLYMGNYTAHSGGLHASELAGNIFHCPSSPEEGTSDYSLNPYAFADGNGLPDQANDPYYRGGDSVEESAVKNPAESIAMVEHGYYELNPRGGPGASRSYGLFHSERAYWTSSPTGSGSDLSSRYDCDSTLENATKNESNDNDPQRFCGIMPRFRHNGAITVTFFDGSVHSFRKGRIDWKTNVYLPGLMPF